MYNDFMRLNFFFDIDGTLLPVGKPIPADAVSALHHAQSLGHRLFLCTGRSPFELTDEIRAFPFDGGVFSAGAYIISGQDTVFRGYITRRQKDFFFKVADEYGLLWILQTDDGSYMTQRAVDYYSGLCMAVHNRNIQFQGFHVVDRFPEGKPISKLFILSDQGRVLEARKALEGPFHSVNNTNGLPPESAAELMSPDFSKASGIRRMIGHLGEDMKSTVGIGDGENDVDMIDVCNIGIAMGNACGILKEHADYVTTDIEAGGIARAVEYCLGRFE